MYILYVCIYVYVYICVCMYVCMYDHLVEQPVVGHGSDDHDLVGEQRIIFRVFGPTRLQQHSAAQRLRNLYVCMHVCMLGCEVIHFCSRNAGMYVCMYVCISILCMSTK